MQTSLTIPRALFASSWLFIVSFLSVVLHAIINWEPSILFTYFLSLVAGYLIFRRANTLYLFTSSFFINVFFAVIFANYFHLTYGMPFSEGADDFAFYDISKKLSASQSVEFEAINYKAYVMTFALYLKFLKGVGINSDFYFHLNTLNSFFGAFAAPLIFLIGQNITSERTAIRAAWITLAYPPVIYYSATIIRDVLVASLLFAIIYFTIFWKGRSIVKVLIFGGLLFYLYHIRAASAFFAFFFVVYHFLSRIRQFPQLFLRSTALLVFVGIVVVHIISIQRVPPKAQPPTTEVFEYLSYTSHYYRDLMVEQAEKGSLGVLVRSSDNPIVITFTLAYMYLSPIPPLFFKGGKLNDIFLGIGNVLWYYFAILFIVVAVIPERNGNSRSFQSALIYTSVLAIIIINFSSGDPRHFYCLQPLIILVGIDYLRRHESFFFGYTKSFMFICIVIVTSFLFLKMVL